MSDVDGKYPVGELLSQDVAHQLETDSALRREQTPLEGENYFPPSAEAKHKYGVLYQGEFETPSDGTATAVRLHARALAGAGVPVLLRSFSGVIVNPWGVAEPVHIVGMPDEVQEEVGHLFDTDIALLAPVIKHVVLRSAEHTRQLLMPRGAVPIEAENIEQTTATRDHIYSNTIVYSVWERDRIDPGIAQHLARVKQCWVPCHMNRLLLIRGGVPADRVHVVPHPCDPDGDAAFLAERDPAQHRGVRRFYSIGRWEPRKGLARLIGAFLQAFSPGAPVTLTIKYSGTGEWPGYPQPQEAFDSWVAQYSDRWTPEQARQQVTLVSGRLTRSMLMKLHAENNIYVSASHGEAWSLPSFDAKLAGNALTYVPYGGVCDFASSADIQIPCEMGLVPSSYQWEHGSEWAEYTMPALAEALRRSRIPETHDIDPHMARFTLANVGAQMKELVQLAVVGRPGMEECYR